MDFVYITDSHIKLTCSSRTGNYLDDLVAKLEFVVDYCVKNDCILLHGGDFFDTPSVSDQVKNRIIPILSKLNGNIYSLSGNHCTLYDNPDYKYKTSFQTLVASGIIHDMDDATYDLGPVVLSSLKPLHDFGKPQIFLYHGFLNKDDGRNSFFYTDIPALTSSTFILLGHDHVVYDPIQYTESVRIIRPGSFARTNRAVESQRNPQLVHIHLANNVLKHKLVPIQCRDFSDVFSTKEATISASSKHESYADVISQLQQASKEPLTLEQALSQVATPDVLEYCKTLLTETKLNNSSKKSNL